MSFWILSQSRIEWPRRKYQKYGRRYATVAERANMPMSFRCLRDFQSKTVAMRKRSGANTGNLVCEKSPNDIPAQTVHHVGWSDFFRLAWKRARKYKRRNNNWRLSSMVRLNWLVRRGSRAKSAVAATRMKWFFNNINARKKYTITVAIVTINP